jgi:hypothetical protein
MKNNFMNKHVTQTARNLFNLGKNSTSKVRTQANRSELTRSVRKQCGSHPKDIQNTPKS